MTTGTVREASRRLSDHTFRLLLWGFTVQNLPFYIFSLHLFLKQDLTIHEKNNNENVGKYS